MGKKTSGRRRRSQADASEAKGGPRAEARRRLEEYERRKQEAAEQKLAEDPRHRPTPHIPLDESEPAELVDWEPADSPPGSATPAEEEISPSDEYPLEGAPRLADEPTPTVLDLVHQEEGEGLLPAVVDDAPRAEPPAPAEEAAPEVIHYAPLKPTGEPAPGLTDEEPGPAEPARAEADEEPGPAEPARAEADEEWEAPEVQPVMPAPLGRRMLALLVDLSLVVLASTLNVAVAGRVLETDARALFAQQAAPFIAFGLILALATLTLGVRLGGQTPGLALMGLEIAAFHGGRVPLGRALLRAVTLFAGSAALGAAGLSAALDPERRGFVDRWAGTEVVQKEET